MAENKQSGDSTIPWPTMMAVVAACGGMLMYFVTLQSSRPDADVSNPEKSVGWQDVHGRLWQDPFKAVQMQRRMETDPPNNLEAFFDKLSKTNTPPARTHLLTELRQQILDAGPNNVLVLPVLVPTGPYSELTEERLRTRVQDQKHRYVRATRGDCHAAGKLMRRGAGELRVKAAAQRLVVADGAAWIWSQATANAPSMDVRILDFYHLSEHIHAAKRVVFGEDDPPGKIWVEQVLHTVKHDGYEAFWAKLVETRCAIRSPAKRWALDELMQYVAAREKLIIYPRCLRMGWDIGSGSTESMCNTLTRRLKLRGMRWDLDNAEAMMALETLEQCNGWDAWRKMRTSSMN